MNKASDYIYKGIVESVLIEEGVSLKEGVVL